MSAYLNVVCHWEGLGFTGKSKQYEITLELAPDEDSAKIRIRAMETLRQRHGFNSDAIFDYERVFYDYPILTEVDVLQAHANSNSAAAAQVGVLSKSLKQVMAMSDNSELVANIREAIARITGSIVKIDLSFSEEPDDDETEDDATNSEGESEDGHSAEGE